MSTEAEAGIEKPADLGTDDAAFARRWKLELKLSGKRESKWRKSANSILNAYTPENPAANSFNILWTNTETLRQACYNSLPQPLVRRRYHDDDPVGSKVAKALQRSLEYCQDAYDFDAVLKGDVLAMLLPGRAVSRLRYVPKIGEAPATEGEEPSEQVEWESVMVERVQWDRFRIGPGKTWEEVPWVAFAHDLDREELVAKFGKDIGNAVPLDAVTDEDVQQDVEMEPLFRTAEVWEIWDKDRREVAWISTGYPHPLEVRSDPMGLREFFPCPRPLYAIEKADTTVPSSLYTQYEQQAKELNRVSTRINKLVDALRVRGVYDATLTEMGELMKAGDNELIASDGVQPLLERGGLEAAIWLMPIEQAANVLKELYVQREQTKAVIYEITGIADIMRAASDPAETFGAQKIKTQWGTQRLQRMQSEVQRYIRDLLRLKAEVVAEKFGQDTIAAMTLLQLPTEADVQQQAMMAQQQAAQAAQQAQASGQAPPPPPPQPEPQVTWEALMAALRDDAGRAYRIDIETDSTLSASQDNDMAALSELLTGITTLVQGIGPAVQAGAIPMEAVKEIILVACRRGKMGSAVEDALEHVAQPAPPQDPAEAAQAAEQAKTQGAMQLEEFKSQVAAQTHQRELAANAQAEQMKASLAAQVEQAKQESQARDSAHQAELDQQAEMYKAALAAEAQQREETFLRWKTELEASVKIAVADISAQAGLQKAGMAAEAGLEKAGMDADAKAGEPEEKAPDMQAEMVTMMKGLLEQLTKPKRIVRGPDGRAVGLE